MRNNNINIAFAALLVLGLAGCGGHSVVKQEPLTATIVPDSMAIKRARLASGIDSLLADSSLWQAQCGLYLIELNGSHPLYARNQDQLFIPASVNKIFTTAAALYDLGPSRQFMTAVYGDSLWIGGKLKGDIYLKGFGDPLLSYSDLEALAFRLKSRGITQISGDLLADASYLDTVKYGAGWMWDEGPHAYNAPISALSCNQNIFETSLRPSSKVGRQASVNVSPDLPYLNIQNRVVTSRSGVKRKIKAERTHYNGKDIFTLTGHLPQDDSVQYNSFSVSEPALYCGALFVQALQKQGIKFNGRVKKGETPEALTCLAWHNSPPLYAMIQKMNKESDNFIAEMLFRQVSKDSSAFGSPDSDTLNGVEENLHRMGFVPGSFRVADGSGLSRYNLCYPRQVAEVLTTLYNDPLLQTELLEALPVAGVDGTLYRRMQNGGAPIKVRAKTGTMTGVSCLAGFAFSPGRKVYCFAMMFNNYPGKATEVRRIQDAILGRLLEIAP
ncbi:D-alanyl-D-alanine carboxypeptidase/D-alanyl-D-alanine-endopeptidase [candidate division TA06 bacterium]|uniref:D-alanyl-D-alanine carboxypeptidase/D-alanyl-D-alanine-endopeptidase n=1 Tax=candidate division TA06 bacterium TaxID=2250710 RepID=A0A933I9J5_UNCT6|nr:D-alanyl-D-alanine carboxypeptidase/D-alanyl-D-alanine-endopeptidase [candidate division TA06 bacterium]